MPPMRTIPTYASTPHESIAPIAPFQVAQTCRISQYHDKLLANQMLSA